MKKLKPITYSNVKSLKQMVYFNDYLRDKIKGAEFGVVISLTKKDKYDLRKGLNDA